MTGAEGWGGQGFEADKGEVVGQKEEVGELERKGGKRGLKGRFGNAPSTH